MDDRLRADLRKAYGLKAAERDGLGIQPWKVEERQRFLELLQQERKGALLEIGSGPGKDGRFFQDHGLDVTCVDLSPEMVALCRAKGLRAEVMDIVDLRFAPGSFDAVYALNCLLHLPKREFPVALRSIEAALKPGGLFYLGLYGGYDHEGAWPEDTYDPPRFFSFFTDEGLRQAVGTVFDPVYFRHLAIGEEKGDLDFQSMIVRRRA